MNSESKTHRNRITVRTLATLLLSVVLMLALALGGCWSDSLNDSVATSKISWIPTTTQEEGQLPAGSVVYRVPVSDEEDEALSSEETPSDTLDPACGFPFDIGIAVNYDFIFLGTVKKVETESIAADYQNEELSAEHPNSNMLSPSVVCNISVRIDKVLSGNKYKVGDMIVVYTRFGSEIKKAETAKFVEGQQAVFFTVLLDSVLNSESGLTWRDIDSDIAILKEPLDKSDVWCLNPLGYSIYPIQDGFVVTPLEWALEARPSVALSEDELFNLTRSVGNSAAHLYPAYYTEKDFAVALKYYQKKYPKGTSVFDDDKWPEADKKLEEIRKQIGFDEKMKKLEDEAQKYRNQSQTPLSNTENGEKNEAR